MLRRTWPAVPAPCCSEMEQSREWLQHCAVAAHRGLASMLGAFYASQCGGSTLVCTGFHAGEAASRSSSLWCSRGAGHSRVLACIGSAVRAAGRQCVDGSAGECASAHCVLHAVPLALPWLLAPALTASMAMKWRCSMSCCSSPPRGCCLVTTAACPCPVLNAPATALPVTMPCFSSLPHVP